MQVLANGLENGFESSFEIGANNLADNWMTGLLMGDKVGIRLTEIPCSSCSVGLACRRVFAQRTHLPFPYLSPSLCLR